MDCATLVTYLSDYLDGNLDEALIAEAKEHLATCQNCRVVLDSTQKTIQIYHETQQQTIPTDRRQRLYEQLESAFSKKV